MNDEELVEWAKQTREKSDRVYLAGKVGPFGSQAVARWRQ